MLPYLLLLAVFYGKGGSSIMILLEVSSGESRSAYQLKTLGSQISTYAQ